MLSDARDNALPPRKTLEKLDVDELQKTEHYMNDYGVELRRILREKRQCQMCMTVPACVILVPCGHQGMCHMCASQVNSCPWCKEPVVQRLKAFKVC